MSTEVENKNNGVPTIITVIVCLLVVAIVFMNRRNDYTTSKQAQTNLINALYDTITALKKNSTETTFRISSLQMASSKQFFELSIKDSQIVSLQETVKKYKNQLKIGSSVTNTTVDTHVEKTTPTTIRDTFIVNRVERDTTARDVILDSKYSDKWLNYSVVSFRDSVTLRLDIINEYSVILGYDKKIPFADVINYNPYSKVTKLRTFQVSVPKQKRWGIGLSSGIGFSNNLTPKPYVGIGVNYNIIKF